MKLGGQVQAAEPHLTAGKELAVVSNYENGENLNVKG